MWTTVAAPPDDPSVLAREKLVQPQLGRGFPQVPRLGVTFHCMQLLDPCGQMRQRVTRLSRSSHSKEVMGYCGLTLGMEPGLVAAEITSCSRL